MKKILFIALFSSVLLSGCFDGDNSLLGSHVAVIPVKGAIVSSSGDIWGGEIAAEDVIAAIEEADANPFASAILLDIDSPGGSVVATKQIVYALEKVEKPKVAYIGEVGASGGYYVAAATDFIYADPDSITGSIGVISMVPDFQGLMEKLGVKMNVLKAGEFKDLGSPYSDFNAAQKEIIQSILSETFTAFKADILDLRKGKISAAELEQAADGRIYSGRQAIELKLIDGLGLKEDALQTAWNLAGLEGEPAQQYYYTEEFSWANLFAKIGFAFGQGFKQSIKENPVQIIS